MPSIDEVLGPGSPLARRLAGYEHREGQLAMARAVHVALENDGHLFVEAGTGTGKTFAYLVPAVLSGRTVVISTATHALQEQIFEKDLPLVRAVLEDHGVELRAALMKGLSNYLCKRRTNERLRSGERVDADLARIERWALETQTGDRAELVDLAEGAPSWRDVQSGTDTRVGAGCKYYDECFVTRMRRQAEAAQIIVVNHHLFFADLALKTSAKNGGGYGGAIPAYDAVVFDEAHQIEGVATDFFGVRISTSRIDTLTRDARRAIFGAKVLDGATMQLVDEVEHAAQEFFRSWQASRSEDGGKRLLGAKDWTSSRRDAAGRLDNALQGLAAFGEAHVMDDGLALMARRSIDVRDDLARIAATATPAGESHWVPDEEESTQRAFEGGVIWIESRERSVQLGASPVDLAPMLRERLFDRVPAVVCTSATLATSTSAGPSFHFAKSRLGARTETDELVVASPFDFAARAALYVAEDMPEPNMPGFEEACAERALALARITGGGAFVLCTSNRSMRAIHAALVGRTGGPLMVQGEAPKHVILDRFRASEEAMLVATMSFWEGVDVPGNALRLVVIDKIPFAVPTDPVVAARCSKIESEGGNPFTQYSVPSAAITLKQGFGRLIRTKRDAGIVALLDRRAAKKGYGKPLLSSLPPAKRVYSIDEVRDFWQSID